MTRARENADGARLDAPLLSPALVTPNLGTPSAGTMTNVTGVPSASLTGALPAISGASLTNLPAGGITEADQWRLNTGFSATTSETTLTANFERVDVTPQGVLGTGMTESSGVFTFPSTGYWLVSANAQLSGSSASRYNVMYIYAGGTKVTEASQSLTPGSGSHGAYLSSNTILDITATTITVYFRVVAFSSSNEWGGNTDRNVTYFTFVKLGAI